MPKEVDKKRQRLFLILTLVFPIVFFILMAKHYAATGDHELAFREYEALIRASPFDARRLLLAAKYQFDNKRFDQSLHLLEGALALKQSANANKWAGHILLHFRKPGEALPYLEKAFEELPNDAQNLFNLGEAYMFGGQKGRAEEMLAQLV